MAFFMSPYFYKRINRFSFANNIYVYVNLLYKEMDFMKPKPDDRRDNVDRIQKNIDRTFRNIEASEDMIERTPDDKMKKTLESKNERRKDAIEGYRDEIKDEAKAKENDYK